ncbi:uncharacterized protein LOC133761679 [Lepus europaeus]|uniref:uncharacterized protein LOC133761679 n=1 Tax=Lepus europaeus TaxID=9983 RepID=UPI002B48F288|nr:uncharacterized protein LOC133761679 [Lepus europaeus]XP_062050250.1 uncharacterized protein LOC133761679 [Lepus europaeus]XP_062050251.1 uncharacterized protein LOC133761679 [Lepus europaeus]
MHVCLKLSIGVTQMALVWKREWQEEGGSSVNCCDLATMAERSRGRSGAALPADPRPRPREQSETGHWGTARVFTARCAGSRASASALLWGTRSTLHTGTQCPQNSVTSGRRSFAGSAWQTFSESTEGNKVLGAVGGPGFSLLSRRSTGEGCADMGAGAGLPGAGQHRHWRPWECAVVDTDCSPIAHASLTLPTAGVGWGIGAQQTSRCLASRSNTELGMQAGEALRSSKAPPEAGQCLKERERAARGGST